MSSGLYETLYSLNALQSIQLQKDMFNVRQAFDSLESGMKKIFEGLKKNKTTKPQVETCQKKLQNKWDFIRKKYIDYMKTQELDCVLRIESSTSSFNDNLRDLFHLVCMDASQLVQSRDVIVSIMKTVKQRLSDFSNFLKVKALRNFTLGSYPFSCSHICHLIVPCVCMFINVLVSIQLHIFSILRLRDVLYV